MNEQEIFAAALEQEANRRATFLDAACGSDAELRRRIENLLQCHDKAGVYFEKPAAEIVVPTKLPPITETIGTQIGPYTLLQEIGEGGMGVVWSAEQHEPVQRIVALKIIKPGMDSRQVIARFEAERQALSLMDHPNIAKVLDAGATESGRPYFVMELVKGQPITQYCDEKHLTPRQRLELLLPVCQAIQHAHQKGIIHRDIKPTNILVAEYDQQPVPKVIDFGVAKAISQSLTEKTAFTGYGQIVGTLEYMSPEQARVNQLDIDTRSDIYSLGVLLYELLTGNTPFDKQRLRSSAWDEMQRIIREEEPPKPSTRLSDSKDSLPSISAQRHMEPAKLTKLVRGELDWIVMKALEKDRARRYETASALGADLQHYLSDEPVIACPPSAGYRVRKFLKRNKGPVAAVGVVLLALVAGLLGTTWGLVRAEKSRRDAVAAQLAATDRAEGERRAKGEAQNAVEAERKAREAETTQRLRAEDNAKLAMAVLDEIIMKEARQRLTLYTQDEAQGFARNPEREKLEREYLEKGLKFYEQLAQTNPTDWTARRERAKAYANVGLLRLDLKKYGESEKAYRQAVQLLEELAKERPLDADNRFDLANAYLWYSRPSLNTGRFQPAEEITKHGLALFEKLAAEFPDRRLPAQVGAAQCQNNLAEVLRYAGELQKAEQVLQQSVTLWAELAAANPAALELRDKLARTHYGLALVHFHKGETEQGIGDIGAAIQQVRYPWFYWRRGIAYRELGMFDLALADLDEAFRNQAFQKGDYSERVLTCLLKGDVDRSLADSEEMIRLAPQAAGGYFCRAGAHWYNRDFDRALADLDKAQQFGTSRLLFYYGGECYRDKGDFQGALAKLSEAIRLDPKYAEAYRKRALVRVRLGQFEEASEDVAQASRVGQQTPIGKHEMAWFLATAEESRLRDVDRAVKLAAEAVAVSPSSLLLQNTLGVAHYRAGNWQAALAAFEKAERLRGLLGAGGWFFRAMTHWKMEKKEEARSAYAEAVKRMGEVHFMDQDLHRFRAEAAQLLGIPEIPS